MKKRRKNYQAEEKVAILKCHLVDGESVWSICESMKLQPSQFYSWQKQFFENGASAFKQTQKKASCKTSEQKQIEQLESKLTKKNEVLSELLEEHIQLKKELGEL